MRYRVPQFIERDIKVVGPMSFGQFIFVGSGVGICFVLYFVLASKSFLAFMLLTTVIMVGSIVLAFGKYRGSPMPKVVMNLFKYTFMGRTFLWKKKAIVPRAHMFEQDTPEEREEEWQPEIREKGSQLGDLATRVETKS